MIPSISVIIPVYNGEAYLAEAIESVLQQTLPPFEVLVVDDGSEDGSADVARRFGAAVRYVHQPHAEVGGAAHARNRGVELARGEYLAFLDADDVWVAEKLAWQVAALSRAVEPVVVYGHAEQFISPELDDALKVSLSCPPGSAPAPVPSTMLVARETFALVGPFDTRWRVGEPLDWHLRATEQGVRSLMLPRVLLRRRLHAGNQGVVKRDARGDYARILKASLDRRRRAGNVASGA